MSGWRIPATLKMSSPIVSKMQRLKEDLQTAIDALCGTEIELEELQETLHSYMVSCDESTGEAYSAYASTEEIRQLEWDIYIKKQSCIQLENTIRTLRASLTEEAVRNRMWSGRKHAVAAWAAMQKVILEDVSDVPETTV